MADRIDRAGNLWDFLFFQYGVLAITWHKSYAGTLNIESERIRLFELLLPAVSCVQSAQR